MRDILADVVRQTSSMFDAIKISGTDAETKIEANDADKTLFLKGSLKTAQPDLIGEFGISNLKLLDGLLEFPSYKADGASVAVQRLKRKDNDTVAGFTFRDANGKGGAVFRAMSADLVGEQAVITTIPWDLSFVPQKAKVAEFSHLASLFNEVDKSFAPRTADGDLIFGIGSDDASTHKVSMVFETGVTAELRGDMLFSTPQFLSVLKIGGQNPVTVSICNRGVLGIAVETAHGNYNYFLRAKR